MAYGDLDYTTKQINTAIGKVLSGEGEGSASIPVVVVEGATPTQELAPNTYYEFGEVTSLTITLAAETPDIYNEYMFEFTSGSTPATLSLPSDIKWIGDEAPTIEANKKYQVSIVNGVGVYCSIDNLVLLNTTIQYFPGPTLVGADLYIGGAQYYGSYEASYKIGDIVRYNSQSTSGMESMQVDIHYTDGSVNSGSISILSDEYLTIEKEISYISVNISSGGGGAN